MTPDHSTPDAQTVRPDDSTPPVTRVADDLERWAKWDGLSDEQGPIPAFGPAKTDESGRLVMMSQEEREARRVAILRMLRVIGKITDETDTDEIWDEVMNALRRGR